MSVSSSSRKRSRYTDVESDDQSDLQRDQESDQTSTTSKSISSVNINNALFRYPFLVPLVALMLNDSDVLLALLVTTRVMKKQLTGYAVKTTICQSAPTWREEPVSSAELCKPDRYLSVKISRMRGITNPDLAYHSSLTSAEFAYNDVQLIGAGMLPCSLTDLNCGHRFNQPIASDTLPQSLRVLELGTEFSQLLEVGSLPSSLTSLSLGTRFNKPLRAGVFPDWLTSLKFSDDWNQPIEPGLLPLKLQYLHFGKHFNQFIDVGVIPCSVTNLTFSERFDQPLFAGVIPSSVTDLAYRSVSRRRLEVGSLPSSMTRLVIGCWFPDMFGPGCFPDSIESLRIWPAGQIAGSVNMSWLPTTLKNFGISSNSFECLTLQLCPFPQGLEVLNLDTDFEQSLVPGILPDSLRELHFSHYDHPLQSDVLPAQLHSFTCESFKSPFAPGIFPSSLRHLELFDCFHPLVPGVIPFGVTDMVFRAGAGERLGPGTFPDSVKKLEIGGVCVALRGSIPASVTNLELGLCHMVKPGVIPNSVTHLSFDMDYDKHIKPGVIPSSVTHLRFGNHVVEMTQPVTYSCICHSSYLIISTTDRQF